MKSEAIKLYTAHYLLAALFVFGLISSCSTTNHPSLPGAAYHDITSYYNAYFNANEKFKAVLANIKTAHKDNYDEIIALEYFSNPQESAAAKSELDEIIKKNTTAIQLHAPSNYADDHFLMMAKAQYLSGDYEKAEQTLKYITTEYKEGVDYVKVMKKKGKSVKPNARKKKSTKPKFEKVLNDKGQMVLQKIDQRPEKKLLVHEPARAEALIWLAKTYTAEKKYAEAASVLQYARSDDKFYKDYDALLELADADNYLRQKDYNTAIAPLEKYLSLTKKKKDRVRPVFVLGQLYEWRGDYKKAAEYYKMVLKNRPNYDMEFYAQIKRANVGRKGGAPSSETKSLLSKMAKDGKYKDYLDQIYYLLAEINRQENNRPEARKYYTKSTKAESKNTAQRALSFQRLAEMDFEDEQYVASKNNYDSVLLFLEKNNADYPEIESRSKILTRLTDNLAIIRLEDSLQRIANMPANERTKFLQKIIAQNEKEKAAKEKAANAPSAIISSAPVGSTDGSAFYFYNPLTRNNGYNEFIRKWGRRKLDDNWRRKDKSVSMDNPEEAAAIDTALIETTASNDIAGIEAMLPLTSEKKIVSNAKMAEAFYNVGLVYKNELKNYRKATQTFEELLKKFPENKYKLESYYQLYLLSGLLKNPTKEATYKNLILTEFPLSKIAMFLSNPNYLDEQNKEANKLNNYYDKVYQDYLAGKYEDIEVRGKQADVDFNPNPLKPKFELLTALAFSKQNRLTDYVQQLNKLVNTAAYKNTPEAEKAQELLSTLNQSALPMKDWSKDPNFKKDTIAIPIDTIAKASNPLSTPNTTLVQSAKVDSIVNNTPKNISTAKDTAKITVKQTANTAKTDTLKKATTTVKNTTAAKDTAKTTVKQTTNTAKVDTVKKATTITVKNATTIKDTAKATVKQTANTAKTDTVKKSAEVVNTPAYIAFDTTDTEVVFGKSDNAPHYIILYYRDYNAYNQALIDKLQAFADTKKGKGMLTVKGVVIDPQNKLIQIKTFGNKQSALDFLKLINAEKAKLFTLPDDSYFIGAISAINYSTLFNNRKIGNYIQFYKSNY